MANKQLDRIEDKVNVLDQRLDKVDVTLAKQHVILEEHVKRTNALEARVLPLEKVIAIGKAILFIGAGLTTVSTLAYNVFKLFQHGG